MSDADRKLTCSELLSRSAQAIPGQKPAHTSPRRLSRIGVGVGAELVNSLATLLTSAIVARSMDARQLGVFVLVSTSVFFLRGVLGVSLVDPMLVRFPYRDSGAVRQCGSAVLACALGAFAIGTIAGLVAGVGLMMSVLAASGAFIILRDFSRTVLSAYDRPVAALSLELVALAVTVGGLEIFLQAGEPNAMKALAGVGLGSAVVALGSAFLIIGVPRLRQANQWAKAHQPMIRAYAMESAVLVGASYVATWVVGAMISIDAVGSLRVVQLLFGIPTTLVGGLRALAMPRIARHSNRRKVLQLSSLVSFAIAGVSVLNGVAAFVLLKVAPDMIVEILGASAASVAGLMLPSTLHRVADGLMGGALIPLRLLATVKRARRARIAAGLLGIAGAVAGSATGSLSTFVWVAALFNFVAAFIWWRIAMNDPELAMRQGLE